MVSMNTKNRQSNIQIRIHVIHHPMVRITMGKVDFWVGNDLDFHGFVAENVLFEDFHALVFGKPGWFVLIMWIVSTEPYKASVPLLEFSC